MPRTKTKSEFVSSAGIAFELVKTLSDEVRVLGGNDDHLRRILSDKSVAREVAELLVSKPVLQSFPLTIDYTQSLAEMVASGNYNYANLSITEKNFPVGSGKAEVQAVLVHLDRVVDINEVLSELDKRGLRPATMVELLAFGAQHPDEQGRFPIIALGSVWTYPNGRRYVGYLWESPGHRELSLDWCDIHWSVYYRFLAVRK